MNQPIALPTYTEISDALEKTESPLQASEVHGLICGIVCLNAGNVEPNWEQLVLGPKKNKNSKELIDQLFAASLQHIGEFSFDFTLVLPDDKTDINVRAECLGLWCQGFLTGLQQAKTPIDDRITDEVSEALQDLTEIAQVNYDDVESNEEHETAYFELLEYVRLVALMIYHELKDGDIDNNREDNLLH